MDDASKAKLSDEYLSSVHRVDVVFYRELDVPLQPPDIDDLQIAKDMVRLHPGNINVGKSAGPDEVYPVITKCLIDFLAGLMCRPYKATL